MKSLEIREAFDKIEKDVIEVYNSIIAEKKEISFIPRDLTFEELIENGESGELPYFEVINRKGDTICARLISVSEKDGLFYVEDEDDTKTGYCGLMDVNGLNYRLSIVEVMENYI